MFEKIKEALAKLDHTNDAHWTQDGQPRLDALKFLAGEDVNRDQVLQAAPELTRATAAAAAQAASAGQGDNGGGDTPPAPPAANGAVPPVPPVPPAPPLPPSAESETPNLGGTQMADADASAELEGSIKDLDVEIQDVMDELKKGNDFLKGLQAKRDELQKQFDALQPPSHRQHTAAVQGYLAAQRAALEARGEIKTAIKEAGLNLKQLAGRMRAPIDAARQRNTTIGVKRPPGV